MVEWFWARLEGLLQERAPAKFESRGAFLVRLRRAAQWMNTNLHDRLLKKCCEQHERADAVKKQRGGKTEF